MRPVRAASRSHIAVCGSTGPTDRYSAIPSTKKPGTLKRCAASSSPPPARPKPVMSYWKACTSSWPRTWSVSWYELESGITIRCLNTSVKPPVPSPIS